MAQVRPARRHDLAVFAFDDVLSELDDLSVAKGWPSVADTFLAERLLRTGAQRKQRNATLGVIEYGILLNLFEERRMLE